MKFENLSLLKQAALIVDIAQLHTHLDVYNVENVGDPLLKNTGLSLPINNVRLANIVYVKLPNGNGKSNGPERIAFSYPKDDRSQIVVSIHVGNDEQVAQDVQLDRFGLTANLLFSGNLEESFARGAKFVKSVEKLTGEDYGISKTLKALAKATPRARALPEDVLDRYYVNHNLACKLGQIAREIGPFDYELSGDHDVNPTLDRPDYNTTAMYNGRTITYHVLSDGSPLHYSLVIDFGYGGDDVVNVGYRYGNQDFQLIKSITPANYSDPGALIMDIRSDIINAVHSSDKHNELENKLNHFIEVYNKATPAIVSSILANTESECGVAGHKDETT